MYEHKTDEYKSCHKDLHSNLKKDENFGGNSMKN